MNRIETDVVVIAFSLSPFIMLWELASAFNHFTILPIICFIFSIFIVAIIAIYSIDIVFCLYRKQLIKEEALLHKQLTDNAYQSIGDEQ